MDSEVYRHKKIEKYLNKITFLNIKIGGLLSHTLEYNFYHSKKHTFVLDLLKIFKYIFLLISRKKQNYNPVYRKYIFTKMIDKFHFNELMDPLIIYFLENSSIVCDENSFDKEIADRFKIRDHSIDFNQIVINRREDSVLILSTVFRILVLLIENKRKLEVSIKEITFFIRELVIQLCSVSFWENYLSHTKPKCVITEFDRSNISSPLILCARKYDVRTITLTHGVIMDYGFTPVLADYIFCWGKTQYKQLISKGVNPDQIVITGNPMIKTFKDFSTSRSNGITVSLSVSPEASSKEMIELFLKCLDNKPVHGIIKLHPSLKKTDYQWVYKLNPDILIRDSREISNNDFFNDINLLIVHQSGIANEALASGVPVVILETGGYSNLNDAQFEWITSAGCRLATNINEMNIILDELISNPELFRLNALSKSSEYLNDLFEYTGKESVQAMVDEINFLITKKILVH